MKILKLLNKLNLSIIVIFLLLTHFVFADETPIDIWNIDKSETETNIDKNSLIEKTEIASENSIYKMPND